MAPFTVETTLSLPPSFSFRLPFSLSSPPEDNPGDTLLFITHTKIEKAIPYQGFKCLFVFLGYLKIVLGHFGHFDAIKLKMFCLTSA